MDSIEMLKKLGLSEYEARTYDAIASLGASSAREVAEYSRLPRNKTYEMLLRLEAKHMILSLPLTPRKFQILDMNGLQSKVAEKKAEILSLERGLGRFIEESNRPKSRAYKEMFWIIKGKKAITEKMSDENRKCTKEILSINRLSSANPVNLRNMRYAIARGAEVRMLVPGHDATKENVKRWKSIGVEIRDYDEKKFGVLGTRIGVFDKVKVRITFGEPDVLKEDDYITMWAESTYLARMMREYFMSLWEKCKVV
jgi:HTH-type transcriptional regulator, sugar sensing transcriptional regulator